MNWPISSSINDAERSYIVKLYPTDWLQRIKRTRADYDLDLGQAIHWLYLEARAAQGRTTIKPPAAARPRPRPEPERYDRPRRRINLDDD